MSELDELWDETANAWVIGPKGDLQVAVVRYAFTAGIIIGKLTIANYYQDRWCYRDVPSAVAAAQAWDGPYPGSEPTGWHRHPQTGRRIDENGQSYILL